jgi:hypothetical protein
MTLLSRIGGSSSPLQLGSLPATLTSTSDSPWRCPGVIGDGRGEGCSVVVGEAMDAVGVEEGKGSRGENSGGGARWCGCEVGVINMWRSDRRSSQEELSRRTLVPSGESRSCPNLVGRPRGAIRCGDADPSKEDLRDDVVMVRPRAGLVEGVSLKRKAEVRYAASGGVTCRSTSC